MNEWRDEGMDEWVNEGMKELNNGWTYEWINKWMSGSDNDPSPGESMVIEYICTCIFYQNKQTINKRLHGWIIHGSTSMIVITTSCRHDLLYGNIYMQL